MNDDATSEQHVERLGWRTLRLPPPAALAFGAVYGAIVGALIAWDIAVVIRGGKIVKRRISEEREKRRQHAEER